ncbi:MAG: Hsp20/alpha crystallin family protein [Bacillota bacterium]
MALMNFDRNNLLSKKDNSIFKDFFNDEFFKRFKEFDSYPKININEEENKYTMEVASPGFDKEDFELSLDNGYLMISGVTQREEENQDDDKNYSKKEFSYKSFKKSFKLPEDVIEDEIDAKYKNGVLKIEMKKDENLQSDNKKIEIT